MLLLRELERLEYSEISQLAGLPLPVVLSMLSAAWDRFHALRQDGVAHDPCNARTKTASSGSLRSETAQNERSACVQ